MSPAVEDPIIFGIYLRWWKYMVHALDGVEDTVNGAAGDEKSMAGIVC